MKAKCIQCGQEFDAKRATASFCNATCRSRHSRNATTSSATLTEPISATLSDCNAKPCNAMVEPEISNPGQSSAPNVTESSPKTDVSPIYARTGGTIKVPGDPGYAGCCIEIDGQWITKKDARNRGVSCK